MLERLKTRAQSDKASAAQIRESNIRLLRATKWRPVTTDPPPPGVWVELYRLGELWTTWALTGNRPPPDEKTIDLWWRPEGRPND